MLKSLVLNLIKIVAQTDKIRKLKVKVIILLLMKTTSVASVFVKNKQQECHNLNVMNSNLSAFGEMYMNQKTVHKQPNSV